MSRTWKKHTHIAAGDSHTLASRKSRKSRVRSQIKVELNNYDEDSDSDLSKEASVKKCSSKYFYDTEKDCVKYFMSLKSSLLNGANTSHPYFMYIFNKDIDKSITSKYCEFKQISLPNIENPEDICERSARISLKKEYVLQAVIELPEQDILNIIHASYASKGN